MCGNMLHVTMICDGFPKHWLVQWLPYSSAHDAEQRCLHVLGCFSPCTLGVGNMHSCCYMSMLADIKHLLWMAQRHLGVSKPVPPQLSHPFLTVILFLIRQTRRN